MNNKELKIEDLRIGDIITVFEGGRGRIHALYSDYYKNYNGEEFDVAYSIDERVLYTCRLNKIIKIERDSRETIFDKSTKK